jgi:hypothetical protein
MYALNIVLISLIKILALVTPYNSSEKHQFLENLFEVWFGT